MIEILPKKKPYGHLSLKVHNVEFFSKLGFWHYCIFSALRQKPNVKYSLPCYDMYSFAIFDIRFWHIILPRSTLMSNSIRRFKASYNSLKCLSSISHTVEVHFIYLASNRNLCDQHPPFFSEIAILKDNAKKQFWNRIGNSSLLHFALVTPSPI